MRIDVEVHSTGRRYTLELRQGPSGFAWHHNLRQLGCLGVHTTLGEAQRCLRDKLSGFALIHWPNKQGTKGRDLHFRAAPSTCYELALVGELLRIPVADVIRRIVEQYLQPGEFHPIDREQIQALLRQRKN